MLSAIDSLLLFGLAHWIVWTLLATAQETKEAKDRTYSIGLIGMVVAAGVLIYKFF